MRGGAPFSFERALNAQPTNASRGSTKEELSLFFPRREESYDDVCLSDDANEVVRFVCSRKRRSKSVAVRHLYAKGWRWERVNDAIDEVQEYL